MIAGTKQDARELARELLDLCRRSFPRIPRPVRGASDLSSKAAERNRSKPGVLVPVLLYHNIDDFRPGTNPSMTISTHKFEKQICWLKRHGYVGITPSDWWSWRSEGKELPAKSVMITFDDAYASVAEHALPLLEKYGFTAAIFVVTDWVGGTNIWGNKAFSVSLDCMMKEQIRKWAAAGFEFGSHTRTHPDLKTLPDDDISREMEDSKRFLSSLLGTRIKSFAYPYGNYTQAARKHAEQTFDLAFTCDEGLNARGSDPYLLRRKLLRPDDTMLDFSIYVTFGWSRRAFLKHWRDLRIRFGGAWENRIAVPGRKLLATLLMRSLGI